MKHMKRLFTLLFALLMGNQLTQAQVSQKMETFRGKVLTEYGLYFHHAELSTSGQLSLSALDQYFMLPMDKKIEIMEIITYQWQESLVVVNMGTKNELWGRNSENGKTSLVESWDLTHSPTTLSTTTEPQKLNKHPWFLYVGEQGMIDSNHNLSLALNARVGFFLLLNRWDLAATYSLNFMGTEGSDVITGQTNAGVMSKVYFPLKNLNLSPHVGGGISRSTNQVGDNPSTQSIDKSILLGISWFIGFGSLDIGFQTGKEVTTMVGFTFFPSQMVKN